jgi:hypothetical protein
MIPVNATVDMFQEKLMDLPSFDQLKFAIPSINKSFNQQNLPELFKLHQTFNSMFTPPSSVVPFNRRKHSKKLPHQLFLQTTAIVCFIRSRFLNLKHKVHRTKSTE